MKRSPSRHAISSTPSSFTRGSSRCSEAPAVQEGARGSKARPLAGKSVALIFLNPSLRTRVSFQVALAELGATAISSTVGSDSWTLEPREGAIMDQDKTEHVKDAAAVLSRYVDAIGVRSFPSLSPSTTTWPIPWSKRSAVTPPCRSSTSSRRCGIRARPWPMP